MKLLRQPLLVEAVGPEDRGDTQARGRERNLAQIPGDAELRRRVARDHERRGNPDRADDVRFGDRARKLGKAFERQWARRDIADERFDRTHTPMGGLTGSDTANRRSSRSRLRSAEQKMKTNDLSRDFYDDHLETARDHAPPGTSVDREQVRTRARNTILRNLPRDVFRAGPRGTTYQIRTLAHLFPGVQQTNQGQGDSFMFSKSGDKSPQQVRKEFETRLKQSGALADHDLVDHPEHEGVAMLRKKGSA